MRFKQNAIYTLVEPMGFRKADDGTFRITRKGDCFTQETKFRFIGRDAGRPIVTPVEGEYAGCEMISHANHFDPDDPYNRIKGSKRGERQQALARQRIDRLDRRLAVAKARLAILEGQESLAVAS